MTNNDGTMEPITGYRKLTTEDIAKINQIKDEANRIGDMVAQLAMDGKVDTRWVMVARTHLQQGFMALTRAVAQPTGF